MLITTMIPIKLVSKNQIQTTPTLDCSCESCAIIANIEQVALIIAGILAFLVTLVIILTIYFLCKCLGQYKRRDPRATQYAHCEQCRRLVELVHTTHESGEIDADDASETRNRSMSWPGPRAAGGRVFTPAPVNASGASGTAAPKRPVSAIPWRSHHLPLANDDPNFQMGQRRACTLDRSTRHYANPFTMNGTGHSRGQCHNHEAVPAAAQSAGMNAAHVKSLRQTLLGPGNRFQLATQSSHVPTDAQRFWPIPPTDWRANRHLAPCNVLPQYLNAYNVQQANAGTSVQSSAALLSLNAAVGKRMATAVPVGEEATNHSTLSLAPPSTSADPVPNLFAREKNAADDMQEERKPHFPTHPAPPQSAAVSVPIVSLMEMLPHSDTLPDAAALERLLPLSAHSLNEQSAAWDRYKLTLSSKSLRAPGTSVAATAPGVGSGGRVEERVAARTLPVLSPNEFSMQWNAEGAGPVTDVVPLDSPALPLRLKSTPESDTLPESD